MRSAQTRHIVITGAGAGIGRALALAYAASGVTLALASRSADTLDATAAACRARGAQVETACVDVRDRSAMADWLLGVDTRLPIDLLIANAGVASTIATASDWEDIERTARVIDTNLYGALHSVLPVVERMRARRQGHIALVTSIAALRGMAMSPAYCASKAAVKAYGDAIRPLLRRDGVQVSVILPGFVKTAMSDVFPGDKRMMWDAGRAARHIRKKLAAGRAEIAFPAMLALGMRLLALLPATVADWILARLSYGPPPHRSE
jgi:short-subunit dehydrogenase